MPEWRHPASRLLPTALMLLGLLCALSALQLAAQAPPADDEARLVFDTPVTGSIDEGVPARQHAFEALRGEVIELRLGVTGGDLAPSLRVFASDGTLVLDLTSAGTAPVAQTFSLPTSGVGAIVVGRAGLAYGQTAGSYVLEIGRTGVRSEEGSVLRYGDSVINTIDGLQPQIYYMFYGQRGDLLTVEMVRSSGSLDPYLQIIDSDATVLADNDDDHPSTSNAAIRGFLVEESDEYVIVASRYGLAAGESVGGFVLTLDTAENSGLGNTIAAPVPLLAGQPVEGALSDAQFERYYRFTARRDDVLSIAMDRSDGTLDPYLILADANLVPLFENDDGGAGQNARLDRIRITADGIYTIVATRYDGQAGETSGGYTLVVESVGSAFDGVQPTIPHLEYGMTATGRIDDQTPLRQYVFWGRAGDTITASLTRSDGDLDAVLELLDADQVRLLRDDDGGLNQNARIERYPLPYTGVYYLNATRFEDASGAGVTRGSYILVLARVPG
jgi:hypothetical protein